MSVYYASFGFLFLIAFLASLPSSTQLQEPTYIYHVCPNTTTYLENSTYSSHLKTLLSSLSSNNPSFSSGFYSTAAGRSPDVVFGLFLCRGDVLPEICRDCIVFAVNDTLSRCPEEKKSLIWYDECMLRYSDENFFLESSLQNGTNGIILINTQNCIPDLTREDCLSCLQRTINSLPTDKVGGRLVVPSCSSKYEVYPFYNESAVGTHLPQLDPASPPPPGEGGNSSVIVIAVVVPMTIIFLLLVAVFSFRAKRKRLVHETEPLAGEDAEDRPTMSAIVQMLTTSSIALAVPRPPGFFFRSKHEQAERAATRVTGRRYGILTVVVKRLIQDTKSCSTPAFSSRATFQFPFDRASAQNPFYLYHNCSITTTYSSNSTYFTNLKTLLSSLSSRNASYSTGFQNATAGQAPDRVTGLFLCRGNVSPEVCRNCVAFAVNEALTRCPKDKEALLYYEQCLIRYSNRNILSTLNIDGGMYMQNARDFTSVKKDRFRDLVLTPMNLVAIEAARSFKKFAVRKIDLTASQSLYGMVQCTPDLTEQDCLNCLQQSINRVTNDKIGGRMLLPSCSSRYDNYPFYNESIVGTPRPGKGGNSSVIIIAVVVPITVLFLLLVAIFSVRAKNKRKLCYEMEPPAGGSLQFDFKAIEAATDSFLEINKLGQGGFGEVYKAWRLWSSGSPLELVGPSFGDNYQTSEITRCIHIALLCVQEDAHDRPNMSAIVQMLTTSSIALAVPRPPGFCFWSRHEQVGEVGPSMDTSALCSVDEASITSVAPR
ncbi:unnamed protein product [Arabidopsis arenosa]|uniref:Gnk2-homologous domain-containing protein n=1 Tax=Arabidopsis arenosa TaxID=38785 RepID=A0A8S2B2K3_ARAAE|nr:unnamed protein product [Arabidopsis arenosa]